MAIPRTDAELALWLTNFSTSFESHAAALGFTEAEVNAVKADTSMLSFTVSDLCPSFKSALHARNSFKTRLISGPVGAAALAVPATPSTGPAPAAVPPGILPRLRILVQRIQLSPGYTEAIGMELGITGPEGGPAAPNAPAKPTLKARSSGPGTVQVDFTKERYDGVFIESRRAGEDGWQSLGLDNYSPYIDNRPPLEAGRPEARQYRARYMLRDQATGEWSDIVTATFVP
jgi:hypothetical protein